MAPKKQRTEASGFPSPSREEPTFGCNFSSLAHQKRYTSDFAHREVRPGRVIDFQFFASLDFPYIDAFRKLGWLDYLSMNRGVYKNLVRVFYSNATNKSQDFAVESEIANSDRFTTYVLGKQIVVDPYFLGIVLGLPTHGRDCIEEDLTEQELDNEVYGFPPTIDSPINSVTRLSFHDRILHLIVSHTLRPKGRNYSSLDKEDMWFIYHIKHGNRVNLVKFIFDDMLKIVVGPHKTLLYGMVVSSIIDYLNLDTRCDPLILESKMRYIGSATIGRLGYVQNKKGRWVKKKMAQEEANAQPSDQPFNTQNALESLMEKMDVIQCYMGEMDDRLFKRILELQTTLSQVSSQQNEMMQRQDALEQFLRQQFPSSSPPH